MTRINWLAYNYRNHDGYGRYSTRCMAALERLGSTVAPGFAEGVNAPRWLQERWGLDWDSLTISCLPPAYLKACPGRHWLYTMTEGSELPAGWADWIRAAQVERLIVPCQHNADTFARGGVDLPIHVIHGGTEPDEFPPVAAQPDRPYTFLALADRGARKGWTEVYESFYKAFGTPAQTPDVRLIIKSRPEGNDVLTMIAQAEGLDPRIQIIQSDYENMADFYRLGDCFVIPSRSEGWGMPHREAAMMGIPVITQAYSGMDDGHTAEWATVIKHGRLEPIPSAFEHIAGHWRRCNTEELASAMAWHYLNPQSGRQMGQRAREWLKLNQTWEHTAGRLLRLIKGDLWL